MNRDTMSPAEARAALDNVGLTRAQMAEMCNCPPWRHAAFGVVMGLLVGGVGFELAIQSASLAIGMGGIVLIAAYDRKRYGVFVNGYRKGATRPLTFALLAVMLALIVVQIWLRDRHVADAVHIAIGFAGFVIGTIASVTWSRIFRRDMERRA